MLANPFLRDLTPLQYDLVYALFERVDVPARHKICSQGGVALYLYCLLEGGVSLQYKPYDGPRIMPTRLHDGDVFGWSAVIGNPYYTSDAVSTTVVHALRARYSGPQRSAKGIAVALDSAGNVYVAGFSPGSGTGHDIFTIKYDNNGNQLWVRRCNGPANGNDIATGLVVDSAGNVYVSGYSATAGGGTEFVTIKYAPVSTIQRQPSGSMLLRFPGLPGSTCGVEATTNFLSWTTLGLVPADTNGVFQFEDTNAPLFPARFYHWHYP